MSANVPRHEELLASAARTATVNTDDQNNDEGYRGLDLIIDATVDPSTASVTFKIEGKDPTSGKYYTLLESAAVASVTTVVLHVYPGATESANTVAARCLPRIWRVTATHADAESITYSVAANLLP